MKSNVSRDSAHCKNDLLSGGNMSSLSSHQSKSKTSSSPVKELGQLCISDQTSTPTDTECKPIAREKLRRLAAIYCAILKAHLAPFILLEFHLLMRLISLSDTVEKSQLKPTNNKTHALAEIFQSEAC
eukprot:scaffold16673_cov66-Skeletonema_marinoi.AAC.1